MENNPHKGTELNNVQETWNENEKRREEESGTSDMPQEETAPATTLDKLIQQEAHEYDNDNKENRLLGGDRASVNDVEGDE
ncbi:hypothetical protein FC093_01950 [Ilyomonas limi]|uniref:Uncharacterized protein n=1 Tax=Ilyomonas limi TaxID=2575867 RepID=A0A4U3LCK6_9BACT|nr:hypothetical protein [Ilyomonas limi]TKK71806.1 hypothetical protein FC093_01950 [Ilyomonas limi]